MVNWQDPLTIGLHYMYLIKLVHLVHGIYIWEFLSTIGFELSVYRGKRVVSWPFWIYSACRIMTLATVITGLVGFNLTQEYDCLAWNIVLLCFTYVSFALASFLLVLRVFAMWKGNRYALAAALAIWATNVGLMMHGIYATKAIWNPIGAACLALDTHSATLNVAVTLATDLILLGLMLAGAIVSKSPGGLWKLIYRQGLTWIILASVTETLPMIFLILNKNDPMNLMFQTPAMITMSICASRMYRDLVVFATPTNKAVGASYFSSRGMSSGNTRPGQDSQATVIAMTKRVEKFPAGADEENTKASLSSAFNDQYNETNTASYNVKGHQY